MNSSLKQRLWLQAAERSALQAFDEERALRSGWQRYRFRLVFTYATVVTVMLALSGSLFLAHSLDAEAGSLPDAPAGRSIASISVRAEEGTVGPGRSVQMTAEGHFSDGSVEPLSSGVAWTSSDSTIAMVDATGLVRAQAPGIADVTATLDLLHGSFTFTVMENPPVALLSIALVPATVTLGLNESVQLVAVGTFSDGSSGPVGAQGNWRSSDPGVAAVNGDGLVSVARTGSAEITMTEAGQTGLAKIEVPVMIEELRIVPAKTGLQLGQSQQLVAQFVYNDGSTRPADRATWSTSNDKVVQVDQFGKASAVGSGPAPETGSATDSAAATATVTVRQGAFSGEADISVFPPSQVE